jgi:hypothetical protein
VSTTNYLFFLYPFSFFLYPSFRTLGTFFSLEVNMRKIRITAGKVSATAVLKGNTTADAIWKALPMEVPGNTWGDEIYFGIPVHTAQEEDASDVVAMGDIAYWPPGHAFCIFFGRTPASRGNEIRAASAVNVFGKVEGDPKVFKQVKNGEKVRLEAVKE